MNARDGFTLVEVLIYLSLLFLISLVLGRVAWQMREYSLLSGQAIAQTIDHELLLDQVRRDLFIASGDRAHWDFSRIVFRTQPLSLRRVLAWKRPILSRLVVQTKDIGFEVDQGSVIRLEGEYDYAKKNWVGQPRKSKLFHGARGNYVRAISLRRDPHGCCDRRGQGVRGVTVCFFINKSIKKSFYVRVRNGQT